MARTNPTAPTAAPTPPIARGDRATFSDRVDATITYLTGAPAEIYGLALASYTNAEDAFANATSANNDKIAAAGSASAASTSASQAAASATALIATSNTSRDIGTGAKLFAVGLGKQFAPNIRVQIVSSTDPTKWMSGTVGSYIGTNLSVNVDATSGTGTVASWNISVTGPRGIPGADGLTGGVNGGSLTSAINFKQATDINVTATPDIWGITGNLVKMIGPGTITGFTAAPQAGARRTLLISGAVTLTNSANLIVQGGTRTLATDDLVEIHATDSTTVFRATVQRASGLAASQPAQTLTLLGAATVSAAVANIDFLSLFTADYDYYQVFIHGMVNSGSGALWLRVAKAGVVDAGNNYTSFQTPVAQIVIHPAPGSAQPTGFGGKLDFIGANSDKMRVLASGLIENITFPGNSVTDVQSVYIGTGPVTGFRLLWSTGVNFTAGTIRVYGIRNAAGVV